MRGVGLLFSGFLFYFPIANTIGMSQKANTAETERKTRIECEQMQKHAFVHDASLTHRSRCAAPCLQPRGFITSLLMHGSNTTSVPPHPRLPFIHSFADPFRTMAAAVAADIAPDGLEGAVLPLVCRSLSRPVSLNLPIGVYSPATLPLRDVSSTDNPTVNVFDIIRAGKPRGLGNSRCLTWSRAQLPRTQTANLRTRITTRLAEVSISFRMRARDPVQLRWMTKSLKAPTSPIYQWPNSLLEKALRNMATDAALAKEKFVWPILLTEKYYHKWLLETLEKIWNFDQSAFLMLGKPKQANRRSVAVCLWLRVRHNQHRFKARGTPCIHCTAEIDFLRG